MDTNMMTLGLMAFSLLVIFATFIAHLFFMREALKEMARLGRVNLAYASTRDPQKAVQAAAALENEIAALDSAEAALTAEVQKAEVEQKGPPIGFKGPNGTTVKFMTPLSATTLAKIPRERLVYDE